VADINVGDVLWIYPPQWTRSGHPDGFPLRIVDLLGRDSTEPDHVWVRGVALDRLTGLAAQEIVIRIPEDQPRADPGNPQQERQGQQQTTQLAFSSADQDADREVDQLGHRDGAAQIEPSVELAPQSQRSAR
jgi:hypothetical protein